MRKPKYLLYELSKLDKSHSAILCLDCGWIRASWSVHDYNTCPCPNQAMVDGGFDYMRYGAKNMDRVQLLIIVPQEFNIKLKLQL